ncbi:CPBP family intramembrane glutamic endopeptidase [Paenimyroides baculatum]|uniref:CPBP family intramembrane metalloprotease n=1 Tax=Paenimyroides baculatum TaxID=2608000 RepID=A0A5M6CJD2_9FLAO|nr:CPBP family intramembrane glutamic endopeptidase [Paenimyroides baculatum]KAA5534062.1 CPBP family intramembrane metalloprotease [Paenimyroides baculatum]
MKQIITDFFSFIKKPKDFQYSGIDKTYKWKVFFTLFIFNICFTIISVGIISVIEEFYPLDHKLDELDLSPLLMLLVVSILIPFIEEVIFRLGLRRKGILKRLFTVEKWSKCFSIFTYISVLIFALVHGTNYYFDNYWFLLLVPFLTLSQFASGFIMTYLRVQFNFWIGYLFHATWNFTAISLTILPNLFGSETIINKETYHLEIRENSPFQIKDKELIFSTNIDTIYQLETEGNKTEEILKAIHAENKFEPVSDYIDIKFTSEKGIPTDSLLHILETEGYIEKKAKTN